MMTARVPRALLATALLASVGAALPLRTDADATALDPQLTLQAKLALLAGLGHDALAIDVDSNAGLVTLHGDVSTPAARAAAESSVAALAGVSGVSNLVVVVGSTPGADNLGAVADEALAADVNAALLAQPFRFASVSVAFVDHGVVALEGSVLQASDELDALQAAQRVPGVRAVKDGLRVESWRDATRGMSRETTGTCALHDSLLTRDVKLRLSALRETAPDTSMGSLRPVDGIGGDSIRVDTRDAVVTLFGEASSDGSRLAAVAAARGVAGVREVRDALHVELQARADPGPQPEVADVQGLAELVRKSLAEQRQHFTQQTLDAIRIDASQGVVRLQGDVTTSQER
jgi:osmotically-inducible protein OsmY